MTTLGAFAGALGRETHVLEDRPDVTWQQLHNRLQWEGAAVRGLVEQERRRRTPPCAPWVRTTNPSPESKALRRVLQGDIAPVWACAFSADGLRIVSGDEHGTLRFWDARSGAGVGRLDAHDHVVSACAFSPDGRWIVSASWDRTLKVWEAETAAQVRTLTYRTAVSACAFSPDGRWLVSAGSKGTDYFDYTLKVWETDGWEHVLTLEGHTDQVNECAFSPNGRRVVSASEDGTLRIWNAEVLTEVHPRSRRGFWRRRRRGALRIPETDVLDDHVGGVCTCAFSPDGRRIASIGQIDETLRVWDAGTGACLRTVAAAIYYPFDCAFSPDGRWIVSAADTLAVWDAETGTRISTLDRLAGGMRPCVFSPDGRSIVSGNTDGTLKVWDTGHVGESRRLRQTSWVTACAFSPNGRRFASTTTVAKGEATYGRMTVRDAEAGDPPVSSKVDQDLAGCAFSPDGRRIVSAAGSRLEVWAAETGARQERPMVAYFEPREVTGCAFSPDGRWIVSANSDGMLTVWDVNSGAAVLALARNPHRQSVKACAYSPDGELVVSASRDGTLKVWEVGDHIRRLRGVGLGASLIASPARALESHTGPVAACAFSPDGRFIVSASEDKTVKVWEAEAEVEANTLEGHTDAVRACAFSPDGRLIVSVGEDKALRVWDATSGTPVTALYLPYPLNAVGLHPWLPRAVVGDADGTIHRVELEGIEYVAPIVTAVDLGDEGIVVRCPVCWAAWPLDAVRMGEVNLCPGEGCPARFEVNLFTTLWAGV